MCENVCLRVLAGRDMHTAPGFIDGLQQVFMFQTALGFSYSWCGNANQLWKIRLVHSSLVQEPLQRQRPTVSILTATVTLRVPPSSSSNVTQLCAFFGKIVPRLPENDVIYLIKPNDETSSPAGMDTFVPQSSRDDDGDDGDVPTTSQKTGDINDLAFQAYLISNRYFHNS